MRAGHPIPARIANAPQLGVGLDLYWLAFLELSTCRPGGMGPGAVPWTAIDRYASTMELDDDQRDDLFHHVREMDAVWLGYQERMAKVRKRGKK